jgi:hypothetical protein
VFFCLDLLNERSVIEGDGHEKQQMDNSEYSRPNPGALMLTARSWTVSQTLTGIRFDTGRPTHAAIA